MKSLIKDNPLGTGLLGIGVILLLAILLLPVFSGGVPEVEVDADAGLQPVTGKITEISLLEPIATFAVIKQRPLFNPDRKPVDIENVAATANAASLTASDSAKDKPLEVDLTGITITNEHKIAMLWDRTSKTTLRIPEGGALEGDLSDWSLVTVEARKVLLKNRKGKTEELELLLFTQSLGKSPGGGNTGRKNASQKTAKGKAGNSKQKNTAAKDTASVNEKNKPMTAADFMRANLEKRRASKAANKQAATTSTKKSDG